MIYHIDTQLDRGEMHPKHKPGAFCWLMPVIIFLLAPGSLFCFSSSQHIASLAVIQPGVAVLREGKAQKIGSFGSSLKNGDTVVTGETGKARVSMPDGDQVLLAPWSKLTIQIQSGKPAVKTAQFKFEGKLRARIRRTRSKRYRFKSANAEVNIKGTEFVAAYANQVTTVATLHGLVNLASLQTGASLDIPVGKMSAISAAGEVLPLSEIAGEILKGVEISGKPLSEEEIAGERLKP